MIKNVGDKVRLNDTLLNDGVITKIKNETYTVLWTYQNKSGKINKHYQLHYIGEFI